MVVGRKTGGEVQADVEVEGVAGSGERARAHEAAAHPEKHLQRWAAS